MLMSEMNVLKEANAIIYGDREKTYGHPSKNLKTIAVMWNAYLEASCAVGVVGGAVKAEINAKDVAALMMLVKVARFANDPTHRDNLVDICGYAALVERCDET
jgi:hypothetical protein